MYTIDLPQLDWFEGGNVYTGSLRTDPAAGMLSCTTFHYKVGAAQDDCGRYLWAICRFVLPWRSVSNIEEAMIACFEVSEFGVEIAENWIRSKLFAETAIPALQAAV